MERKLSQTETTAFTVLSCCSGIRSRDGAELHVVSVRSSLQVCFGRAKLQVT